MVKNLLAFCAAVLTGLFLVGAALILYMQQIDQPGPLAEDTRITIQRGIGLKTISLHLKKDNIIADEFLFEVGARLNRIDRVLKAGEYDIPAQASIRDVLSILEDGQVVSYNITIPEGLTVVEAIDLIKDNQMLKGEITKVPAEGWLHPETYAFVRGSTRQDIVDRMVQAQEDLVEKLWQERSEDSFLTSKDDLLTLASIIEKETSIAAERRRVAGVFVNRLQKNMRLQTDPTVIYAITMGQRKLERALTRHDIKTTDSSYNTYKYAGLPPGPIANPGKKSLEAALNPEQHNYFYFVADGTGGHVFSKSLKEHNRNVAKWRKIRDAE